MLEIKSGQTGNSTLSGLKFSIALRVSLLSIFIIVSLSLVFLLVDMMVIKIAAIAVISIAAFFSSGLISKKIFIIDKTIAAYETYKKDMAAFAGNLEKASKRGFVKAGTDDESKLIAQAFNYLLQNSNNFVSELDKISEEALDVSRHLASTTEGTTNNMENVTSALNEFSSVTEDLEVSSGTLTGNADKVEHLAQEGMDKIKSLEAMMEMIKQGADKAAAQINDLSTAAAHIENIISVISDIADSTNMLALNASIEAARAGESGKGFTVVAQEIRKLAQDTQNSLGNINELISNLRQCTTEAVETINDNNGQVINCKSLVADTSDKFKAITKDISSMIEGITVTAQVSDSISKGREEISAASEEQIASIREIDDMAKQLSQMAAVLKEKLADTQVGGTKLEINLKEFDKKTSSITKNQKQGIIDELGIKNKFVISVIARLETVKGHEFLLKALKPLTAKYNNWVCLVVGDGSLEEALKDYVKSEGMADKVKFLGFRKDIQLLLSVSDLSILTSQKEGRPPRILLEAMASEKPVIATELNGTRYIVQDKKTGFLVKYGDTRQLTKSIEELVEQPDKCIELGKAGRKALEELVAL